VDSLSDIQLFLTIDPKKCIGEYSLVKGTINRGLVGAKKNF